MSVSSLRGLNVLVTRPRRQQQGLCNAIEAAGGTAVSLPLIEIEPLSEAQAIADLTAAMQYLDSYDVLIFISTNAVKYGGERIADFWPQFPPGVRVIAVGPTTAKAARELLGCEVMHSEAGMTSEDLLNMPELQQVNGARVGIVRGQGGREILADTLKQRGAEVEYLESYIRRLVHYEPTEFKARLTDAAINVLTATSSESLNRLIGLLGDMQEELVLPLLVPSARIASEARTAGFTKVINTGGANEASFIVALGKLR